MIYGDVPQVLSYYDVGEPIGITPLDGTANYNFMVRTPRGEYFLRRRNKRYAGEVQLKYDHSLMRHLAARGIAGPNPITSRDGRSWVTFKDWVYELHPFIRGDAYERKNVRKLASAGRALARFHRAAADFNPPAGGEKELPRYDDPREVLAFLREVSSKDGKSPSKLANARMAVEYLLNLMEKCLYMVTDETYSSLPHTIIHGDYHPGNVKFRGDEVCGIFDLDWASRQPRVRDIADGILYFAADREFDIDGGNIYSLTQPCKISVERSRIFVTAYCEEGQLLKEEIRSLPWFIRMRWVYCRYSGMRKVPQEQSLSFFFDRILEPLLWLDSNEDLFVDTVIESIAKVLHYR